MGLIKSQLDVIQKDNDALGNKAKGAREKI